MNVFLKIEFERILSQHLPDVKIEIIKQENLFLMVNIASDQFPMKSLIGRIRYIKYLIKNDERRWNEKFVLAVNPMDIETFGQLIRDPHVL